MIFTKNQSLAIAGATSMLFLSSVGASNAIGLTTIPVSNFTNLTAGSGATSIASGSTLNADGSLETTLGTVDSFGGFFTSDFVAVGAVGNQLISDSTRGVNSNLRTTFANGFTLSSTDLSQPLRFSFNYAFVGVSDQNITPPNFLVQLIRFSGVGENVSNTRTLLNLAAPVTGTGTIANDGTDFYAFSYKQNAFSIDVSLPVAFTAGTYGFSISLTEPTGDPIGNQAAGFNDFTVQSVPFDFNPSFGIGLLGLGFGLNKVRKNWKAKKNTEV